MKKAVERIKKEPDNLFFPDKGKQYGNNNYGFILNNCQDFVSEVLDEYKNQKRGKEMKSFLKIIIIITDIAILVGQAIALLT